MAALLKQLMGASRESFATQDNLATTTLKITQDLESLRSTIHNTLTVGDNIFGQMGHADLTQDVNDRNKDLQSKKDTLLHDIDKKEAIINRSNRDFSDVNDTLPETQTKKKLNFIEDYTMAILSMAYVFMLVTAVYFYISTTTETIGKALLYSILGSTFVTLFAFMLLYYLT